MNHAALIAVRRATVDDLPRILDIASRTWDGTDYIHNVAERWILSPDGVFVVGEYDGVVCGFGRLEFHGPRQGWLQGLRVDGAFLRRGVARAIGRYLTELAIGSGLHTLRFSTSVDNKESVALNEAAGFVRIGGGRWLDADLPLDELAGRAERQARELAGSAGWAVPAVARLCGGEVDEGSPFVGQVLSSKAVEAAGGMIPAGFMFYPADPGHVVRLAREGYCYSVAGAGEGKSAFLLASISPESSAEEPGVVINVLEGDRLACAAALAAAFGDFAREGISSVVATVPCGSTAMALLEEIGYTSWVEDECPADKPSVIVFDYPNLPGKA